MRHRPLGGQPAQPLVRPHHLVLGTQELNQDQKDRGHKTVAEKTTEKKDREGSVGTRVPPEHLHTRNKKDVPQDNRAHSHDGKKRQDGQPPPLMAAAQELINNDIRGSNKKTYKSKVGVFATYCTKGGTNTKSCHPNTVINILTMLAQDKGLSY